MPQEFDSAADITNADVFKAAASDKSPIQRIKVIGVGGGGNNAVIHMYKQGIKDVSFILLNTDRQVLDSSDLPQKVLIGPGRGAGGKPERARKYAEESAEQIADLFDDDTDMVFITAGMGGGTGTGAGPVVARIAKEKGILTVGIVTVPFLFEGQKKILKALEGVDEMAKNVDSLLVINNQRLRDIYRELHILNAFAKADDTLLNAAQSITDIITKKGIINRDFNDVDTTLRDGGTAIISTGYGEGPNRVTAAIQDALHSPLLKNTDIFGSKKLLMVLYVSDDPENHPFNMDETQALEEFIDGIDDAVDVMWGLYEQPGLEDKVRITLLASGFEVTINDRLNTPTIRPIGVNTKPNNETIDEEKRKRISDTYGNVNGGSATGRVLDPSAYDDPDDETLRQIESQTAIERNPYKQYISGVNSANFDQDATLDNIDKVDKQAPATEDRRKNQNSDSDKGSMMLNFDDIDS